jgi:hypothetical protein
LDLETVALENSDSSIQTEKKQTINVGEIYGKISPYITNLDYIKDFLEKHTKCTREELTIIIESELKNKKTQITTDLRILLNSL